MSGPFDRADDPVAEARESLERGAEAGVVGRFFVWPSLLHRQLAGLRRTMAEFGGEDAFDDALERALR